MMKCAIKIITTALTLLFAAAPACVAENADCNLEKLILNDGDRVTVLLANAGEQLTIMQGIAERVPSYPPMENTRELDIRTFDFKIKARTDAVEIAGPKTLTINGITPAFGGGVLHPALVIDEDAHVELRGATNEIFIKVDPIARVKIDARKLSAKSIYVVNNPRVVVTCLAGTEVSLLYFDYPQVTSTSNPGADTTPAPSAPQPGSTPPAPPAAPGEEPKP